ncbi:hypothetical protein KSS87_011051 [Heliosperma pusillum]|nr:hypothetical protein KSS87_011051 [Heliosperma pusillum]
MNYLLGAFKPACHISFTFADEKNRKKVPVKRENGQTVMVPLFHSQDNIFGQISVEPVQGKKIEHNGIKVELLGQIEMYFDRGNFYDFTSLVRELDVPGDIYERKTYPFEFSTVEMPYETYNGVNVRLRYVLKVTISRGYAGSIIEYHDFVVRNYSPLPSINNSIKMEVGIEDCMHIEFEYNKSKSSRHQCSRSGHPYTSFHPPPFPPPPYSLMELFSNQIWLTNGVISLGKWLVVVVSVMVVVRVVMVVEMPRLCGVGFCGGGGWSPTRRCWEVGSAWYHLKDVIIGKIYFLLVRIKIKNMDLEIRRRESTGSGANTHVETETLAKFELMDGAPVRGESIPLRLFLSPYELTPTYRNTNNKFSVKYYLNLVLVDEEDRRYFKQQEITLFRLADN